MHKFSSSAAVLEHELSEVRLLVERTTGILLDTPAEALAQMVADHLEARRLASAGDLLTRLRASDSECETLAERMLDGETAFFRHPKAFEALTKVVVPEIQSLKSGEPPRALRFWSAGCSTGEEPYSLAMSVCEAMHCHHGGWNVHVVASDIRRQALQVAERGLYPHSALAHLPQPLVRTYFGKVGEHFLVKPRLRNLVTFAPMNLARPVYIGRFDCIFCMDVLPHFSMAQRVALVQRLHLYLEPGGYLFLGDREKLPAGDAAFNFRKTSNYILYQKPRAAAAKSGR